VTGYGDIVAVNPFARSLANLESVIGQFYLAITVARLVTLELEERRRRPLTLIARVRLEDPEIIMQDARDAISARGPRRSSWTG